MPLSPTKSSGTIEINTSKIGTYQTGSETKDLNGIAVTYTPSFTAWEKQGYLYQNGVVWITKEEKVTPAELKLYTIQNGTDRQNETLQKWYPAPSGTVIIPQFTVDENKTEITGTSTAKLRLNATLDETETEDVTVTLTTDGTPKDYSKIRWLNIEVSVE